MKCRLFLRQQRQAAGFIEMNDIDNQIVAVEKQIADETLAPEKQSTLQLRLQELTSKKKEIWCVTHSKRTNRNDRTLDG
jgi:hypothetical protein